MQNQKNGASDASVALTPDELTADEILALREAVVPDSARHLDHLMTAAEKGDEPIR